MTDHAWAALLELARAGATRAEDTLDPLYGPLCAGPKAAELVIAHLAQSLDGRIATVGGSSRFISGEANLIHAHRLRALCDAVVVGSRTVDADDPLLTTRLVAGPSPTRVIIDPRRRLDTARRVFRDGDSPTLLVCASGTGGSARHGHAEVIAVDGAGGVLSVVAILAALRRRGLRRILVEGGGVTVSRFLEAGQLTRLQIAVAPLLLGSGRPSLTLPIIDTLASATKLDWRYFPMGRDILFDCAL